MSASPEGEQDWCPRCGQYWPSSHMPCRVCWDGRPEPEVFERIVTVAAELSARREAVDQAAASPESVSAGERRQGSQMWTDARDALSFLAGMADPDLAPRLAELALDHPEEGIRASCATSLGWLQLGETIPVLERLLRDESAKVRREALFSLGDCAGGDVLAQHMVDAVDGEERLLAALGLAWLEDRRAFAVLKEAARDELLAGGPSYDRTVTWGFVRLAEPAELIQMAEALKERAALGPTEELKRGANALVGAVYPVRPADLEAVSRPLAGIASPVHLPPPPLETPPPRTAGVPRRAIVAWQDTPPNDAAARPRTKRGGQPDWRSAPAWPVDETGRPFQFAAQFDLGERDGRTAYVFFDEWNEEDDEPLGSANAVVVQPGPVPAHVRCVPHATGPRPFARFHADGFRLASPYTVDAERWAEERDGFDPEAWEDDEPSDADHTGARIGGTPNWKHFPESPPGEGWHFAFQFSDDFFDYYGFVNDDGRGALISHAG